jgi:hypothetical protein
MGAKVGPLDWLTDSEQGAIPNAEERTHGHEDCAKPRRHAEKNRRTAMNRALTRQALTIVRHSAREQPVRLAKP